MRLELHKWCVSNEAEVLLRIRESHKISLCPRENAKLHYALCHTAAAGMTLYCPPDYHSRSCT